MKRVSLKLIVFCLLLAFLGGISTANASQTNPKDSNDKIKSDVALGYGANEVIVKFKPHVAEKDKDLLKSRAGITTVKKFSLTGSELAVIKDKTKVPDVVAKLKKNPHVLYAEPNYIIYPSAAVNDPLFDSLWGLHNTGQSIGGITGMADIDIDAPEAWGYTKGSSQVVVAVIDEWVDINHPDISSNVWVNPYEIAGDGLDNDGNGLVDDVNGWDFYHNDNTVFDSADGDDHGTHVAGTIAAVADNAAGVAGVAPNVKIMPLKFLGPKGGYTSDAIAALGYAKKMGATLSSNSWGSDYYSSSLYDAINSYGGVFAAAAGNNGRDTDVYPHYPSSYDCANIISVAALNNRGSIANFSNYGVTSVDVGAPGVDVLSLIPGSSYGYMSGTSMATPHVSGIAALMLSIDPTLTALEIVDLVKQSAIPLDSLQGKTASGGMANANDAIIDVKGFGPHVTGTDPVDGALGVPLSMTITVTFNEDVQPGDNFNGITLAAGNVTVPANYIVSGGIMTIDPVADLSGNTKYTVNIPAGAVKNASGVPMSLVYSFSFSTPDTLAPVVVGTEPAGGAVGVPLDAFIIIYFDESVKPGTDIGSITVNNTSIESQEYMWGIDNAALYIKPYANFTYENLYTVSVPAGAVTDLTGNALQEPCSFSFTTTPDVEAPYVGYTDPEPGMTGVSVNKKISVMFNESIEQGLYFRNIKVSGNSADVTINASVAGDTLNIEPTAKLDFNTSYTVAIPAGSVMDTKGNALAVDHAFSFTTGSYDVIELPFWPNDAVMDPDKTVVYLLNGYEGKVCALDYTTGAISEINLGYTLESIDIGRGQQANELYVAATNRQPSPYSVEETQLGTIFIIDRFNFTVVDSIPVGILPYDLVAGRDGHIYVTSGDGQWTTFNTYDRITKQLKHQTGIRHMSYARLHPVMERIYTITTDISPRDYTAYNISNGIFTDPTYPGGYDSRYHGEYPLNTNFALDPTGEYIFNGSGVVFTASPDQSRDMLYYSKLNMPFADIAFEPDMGSFYTLPLNTTDVYIYRGSDLTMTGGIKLAGPGSLLLKQGNQLVAILDNSSNLYPSCLQVVEIPTPILAIVGTDPVNGETNVAIDKTISVTFNDDLQQGPEYGSISLTDSAGSSVAATTGLLGHILTVTPSAALHYGQTYTLTVPAGAVKDSLGNALQATTTVTFTTISDTTAPTVASTDPAEGDINVVISKAFTVTFSENVVEGAEYGTIALIDGSGSSVAVTKGLSGNVLTITPSSNLAYGTTYTLTVPSGAVRDAAGNTLAADTTVIFTTEAAPDTTAPTVASTNPSDGQTGVVVTSTLTVTFSEDVVAGDDYDFITLNNAAGVVGFAKVLSGNVLTITPSANLASGTTYTLTVPSGAVWDAAGNTMAVDTTVTFTTEAATDTTAPAVESTDPAGGAKNVPVNQIIVLAFSEDIITGSNFGGITVLKGRKVIDLNVTISGNTLILDPLGDLANNSTYTVDVPSGAVADTAGNPLAVRCSFSFTTQKR